MGNFLIGASTGAMLVVFLFWGPITQDKTGANAFAQSGTNYKRYTAKRCDEEILPMVRRADRDLVNIRRMMDYWNAYPQWFTYYQTMFRNTSELAQEEHAYYEKYCGGKPWNDGTPWN
jgi:hypothetical protein